MQSVSAQRPHVAGSLEAAKNESTHLPDCTHAAVSLYRNNTLMHPTLLVLSLMRSAYSDASMAETSNQLHNEQQYIIINTEEKGLNRNYYMNQLHSMNI